jgi:hypothetical protein
VRLVTPSEQKKVFQLCAALGGAALAFSLLFSLYAVWRNVNLHRTTQAKAFRVQQMDNQAREWQAFFAELIAYSDQHPSLNPVLEKYRLKQPAPSAR